jgi:hypothetical protein
VLTLTGRPADRLDRCPLLDRYAHTRAHALRSISGHPPNPSTRAFDTTRVL